MQMKDIPLLCYVANALARALEQSYLMAKLNALADQDDLSIVAPRNQDHTEFFEKIRAKVKRKHFGVNIVITEYR